VNERRDGFVTKGAIVIFTEGKGEGLVMKYATKKIRYAGGTTRIVSVYV
jgi:hypothetical protein